MNKLKLKLTTACLNCETGEVTPLLELGSQPISNQFTTSSKTIRDIFDISLGACVKCELVQVMSPIPHTALISPYEWSIYREPEGHLDHLVNKIMELSNFSSSSTVLGISSKDRSTIERFKSHGLNLSRCLDPYSDLGITIQNAGIESVQKSLDRHTATNLTYQQGQSDIVVARHIIEHAENPIEFIGALATLVKEDGYLVVEVPDCLANLERGDITMVWEEHSLYFTPNTFRSILPRIDFEEVIFENYPLIYENCLVLVGRKTSGPNKDSQSRAYTGEGQQLLSVYADAFKYWQRNYRDYLENIRQNEGLIALYGAGHLGCAFVNYYELSDLFSFVVDDTPEKQGLFLPGSGIEIVSSTRLLTDDIKLCLLTLSPEIEDKVIENNYNFTQAGGRFESVFVASPRSMRKEPDNSFN